MDLGLLGYDSEWYKFLDEVEVASTPNSFWNTFAMVVMENYSNYVPTIFQIYHKQLSEDYQFKYRKLTNEIFQPFTDEVVFSLSLYLMREKVRNISDSNNEDAVRKYGIPEINEEQRTRAR